MMTASTNECDVAGRDMELHNTHKIKGYNTREGMTRKEVFKKKQDSLKEADAQYRK